MKKLMFAAAMAAGVALAGGRGQDEKGEYWQSDDGVKHYFNWSLSERN